MVGARPGRLAPPHVARARLRHPGGHRHPGRLAAQAGYRPRQPALRRRTAYRPPLPGGTAAGGADRHHQPDLPPAERPRLAAGRGARPLRHCPVEPLGRPPGRPAARQRGAARPLRRRRRGGLPPRRGPHPAHPLLAGATGAGKTFMSKSMLAEAETGLRVATIEDALEMAVRQPNCVRLLFAAGGEGGVTPADCLHAALRMRPDLIPVQELREPHSAWVYLNEIATGHPGSPTTIHGETAPQAVRRLFSLLKGSPQGASISDEVLLGMIGAAIDVIVPIGTEGASRRLGEVWFADDAARRGETIADLLRAP
ncbi:ATPase, T2SS/T4P/T4SS family [Paeniroseomonas aquatica]|uniref:ATPase, T2SS/T4P/T4SS family n=1 Tax=Paeniroseomonas aquatica TaxID=373043 RepID=UPI003608AB3A